MAFARRGQMIADMKPDDTPVTEVDHLVEDFLIERILARYPNHQILSEESGRAGSPAASAGNAYTWVIDPIDGTRAFAAGLPVWGISVGILREDEPYAGGFYMPVTGDLYWGWVEQAYYQERPLPRLHTVAMNGPLAFLAVPSDVHLHFQLRYPRVRSMGSTAAHLAYAAVGAAVGVLTRRIGLWDIAGLLPLLSAVGIQVTHLDGRPFHPREMLDGLVTAEPLLAAHPSIASTLREQITEINK